jgi:aryl-alcohol dehydrogenase-like predicted oxidoreductase
MDPGSTFCDLIRHIGCTSHTNCRVLIEALKRFDFEIILVPLNIVEREPLDELIPRCLRKGWASPS